MIILIGLFFCHFLADFTPLSMPFMLKAKRFGTPLFPIWLHSLVHACLMFLFLICFIPADIAAWCFIIQCVSYFLIDVGKGKINFYFPATRDNTKTIHWVIFGLDQWVHALVIICMYYFITNG